MSKTPSMPLFCGDYLGDTKHLSLEEHGAYLMILMVSWQNAGKPLPDSPARMARILGISVNKWQDRIRPVLVPYFDLSAGEWFNKRLQKEWNFVQERAARSRDNGTHGGRPKSPENNKTQNPAGSFQDTSQVSQTESTPPNLSSKEKKKPSASKKMGTRLPADFVVSDEWIVDGEEARKAHGLPPANLRLEATKFPNFWCSQPGQRGTKLDWHRTWINRCLDLKGDANGRANTDRNLTPVESLYAGAAMVLADRERARQQDQRRADPGEGDGAVVPLLDGGRRAGNQA